MRDRIAPARALSTLVALAVLAVTLAGAESSEVELRARDAAWRAEERLAPAAVDAGQRVPLAAGTLLGEIAFAAPWRDFRGQTVAPGRYGLRYGLQPRLKEHAGADAVRDFALLVPIDLVPAESAAVAEAQPLDRWIEASRHVSGSRHPAVLALVIWSGTGPPPDAPVIENGRTTLFRRVGDLALGFVVEGRAETPDAL